MTNTIWTSAIGYHQWCLYYTCPQSIHVNTSCVPAQRQVVCLVKKESRIHNLGIDGRFVHKVSFFSFFSSITCLYMGIFVYLSFWFILSLCYVLLYLAHLCAKQNTLSEFFLKFRFEKENPFPIKHFTLLNMINAYIILPTIYNHCNVLWYTIMYMMFFYRLTAPFHLCDFSVNKLLVCKLSTLTSSPVFVIERNVLNKNQLNYLFANFFWLVPVARCFHVAATITSDRVFIALKLLFSGSCFCVKKNKCVGFFSSPKTSSHLQ